MPVVLDVDRQLEHKVLVLNAAAKNVAIDRQIIQIPVQNENPEAVKELQNGL